MTTKKERKQIEDLTEEVKKLTKSVSALQALAVRQWTSIEGCVLIVRFLRIRAVNVMKKIAVTSAAVAVIAVAGWYVASI